MTSPIKLPAGLIDYATFQRESGWSAARIDHAVAGGSLHTVACCGVRVFFLDSIPETSGSTLLREHLAARVGVLCEETLHVSARLQTVREWAARCAPGLQEKKGGGDQ